MKKLLIIPILFFAFKVSGTTYYVKNAGNDSNTGLSDAQAWAHHPWMSTWKGNVTLAPGDVVYMKRGNNWTIANPLADYLAVSQNGSDGMYITTTAYGIGDDPVIKISTNTNHSVISIRGKSYIKFDHLHIQHWSSTFIENGDNMNGIKIYEAESVPHDIIITNCEIDHVPLMCVNENNNAYNIIIGDITATQTATPTNYSNHFHDFGYAGVYLKGCDPVSFESHFNVYYNYIHDATRTAAGDMEYGIVFGANPDSHAWPKHAIARYNYVENIYTWEGIECHGGSYIYFLDNYVKNFGALGIWAGGTGGIGSLPATSNNIYIERNIVEQSTSGWKSASATSFIMQYSQDNTIIPSEIYIRDNSIFYTSKIASSGGYFGIRLGNVDGITVSGNKIFNGSVLGGVAGIYITNNNASFGNRNVIIKDNLINQWGAGINIDASTITGSVSLINNIVYQISANPCLLISDSDIPATAKLTIYNNTLITEKNDLCIMIDKGIANGGSVVAKNNIIGWLNPVGSYYYYWYWGGTISGTFICDNNLYWNSSSGTPFYSGHSARDWTSWTTNLRLDAHGVGPNTDPLFRNLSGSYLQDLDFDLQSSSPAINAGTDVGLTTDYAGNPISGLPDIGAFEYIPAQLPPAPVYQNSIVTDAAPSVITMSYNLDLANIVPVASAFAVRVNSSARSVNSVSVSGKQVSLTLASAIAFGDAVTVAYTKPSSNPLQSTQGGQAESFPARTVTNDFSPPLPVYVSSVIHNSSPSLLELTYSLSLANIVPAASAFAVTVNSVSRSVSSVSVSGTKVNLTLSSPAAYGDVIRAAYTKPSSNPLQTPDGGQAASFSSQNVTNNVAAPIPVYVSSSVENATSSRVDINYNLSLASIVPAASAFTVTVNSAARSVSSVAVSGTKVMLTLSSAVANGNTVTVAYTKPSSNPLQASAGGQAASFTAQNVTNNVAAVPVPVPVYLNSSVENATPSRIDINYNLSLANIIPAASAFTVTVNSAARSVSSVAVSGTKVMLTLSGAVANGNTVTVAYTKPSSNPLQTPAGGQVASFTSQNVTNNVAAVPVPVYVSSSIENATPSRIDINYNLSLANIVPAASAFTVTVNSIIRSVSSVTVSGAKVLLTLASPVIYGDKVAFSYTKPSANPLQTPAGGQAASLAGQTVTNRVEFKNTTPEINVVYQSPVYSGFVSEIDASGSRDADNDNLTFSWVIPQNIPVSSVTGSKIKFLSPVVDFFQTVDFVVNVSDGKTTVSRAVMIGISPYEPGLSVAEVIRAESSSFASPNNPYNSIDGNIGTMWAASGDNQWLLLELREPFQVQHVKLAFLQGQNRESYFDILGSDDKVSWEPVLLKSNSCSFSGNLQVFDFPPAKTVKEYRYIKLVGHCSSADTWNYISEFRIFGYPVRGNSESSNQLYRIYPNPARDNVNIVAEANTPVPAADRIRISTLTGNIVYEDKLNSGLSEFSVPLNLRNGIYIIQMCSGRATVFSQKLIIRN